MIFTQTYYYEVTAVTPLGTSTANTNGQQAVATVLTVSGNTANVGNQITNLTSTAGLLPGMQVSGAGIPLGLTILSVDSNTQVTLTGNATATATGVSLTFSAATVALAGTTSLANAHVTALPNTTYLAVGMVVTGVGIPAGTTVVSVDSATQVTLSATPTAAGASTLTFTPAVQDLASTLSWTAVSGATSYNVYRSLTSGDFAQGFLTSVAAGTTTYTDLGPVSLNRPVVAAALDPAAGGTLLSGTPYYYVVTAVGVAGETLTSQQVTPTVVLTGSTHSTTSVTNLPSTSQLSAGMAVSGSGIPAGTTILAIVSTSAITLSQAATTSVAADSLTFLQTPIAAVVENGVTHGTTTVDGLSSTSALFPGMAVTGTGILPGTTIATIVDGASITLSQAASGNSARRRSR